MAENFYAAAHRHFDSADVLLRNGRRVEASQLYAYACECALKAILGKQGHSFKRVHINDHLIPPRPGRPSKQDLVSSYQAAQQGRAGASYLLANSAILAGWTVGERYQDGAAVKPHLEAHLSEANDVRRVFRSAIGAGVLP